MKHVIKHLQLPSGLQSGLPMVIDDDCITEQMVAVADVLQSFKSIVDSSQSSTLWQVSASLELPAP
jgi:hypothetical protein